MGKHAKEAPILCMPALCYNLSPEEWKEFKKEFPWFVTKVVLPYFLRPSYRNYVPFYYSSSKYEKSMYEIKEY